MAASPIIRLYAVAALLTLAAPPAALVLAQDAGLGEEAQPAAEAPADAGSAEGEAGDEELTAEERRIADLLDAAEDGASGEYEQEEDDDFVPTQEVSSDQSVNFPVDI